MGLVVPELKATNYNGFTLSSTSNDSSSVIYGPFTNSSDQWIAATGGMNEKYTINCSYPITFKSFAIISNMQSWKIYGSASNDDDSSYMLLYDGTTTPLDLNTIFYYDMGWPASWYYVKIVNTESLSNNEKVTIKFLQFFN